MNLTGHYTNQGLALTAKLLAGSTLTITRVVAGSGSTADPSAATVLPLPRQTLSVGAPTRSGATATLPVTLVAAQAQANYTLRELGVYARDPQKGEILYKVYKLDDTVEIRQDSRLVLRFYLEETVSEDLNAVVVVSPAGLVTQSEFAPVREKVTTPKVPTRSVTLEASELQAYLDSLPKFLTEQLTLSVHGTLTERLIMAYYSGPGSLSIQASASDSFTVLGGIYVTDCSLSKILFSGVNFAVPETFTDSIIHLDILRTTLAEVTACTFTGNGTANVIGIKLRDSEANIGGISASSLGYVVYPCGSSVAVLAAGASSSFHDNLVGVLTYRGGTAFLCDEIPDLLGASSNIKSHSGLIVNSNGTLL